MNALAKAQSGQKVTGKAAEGALKQAVTKLKGLGNKVAGAKESAKAAGGDVVGILETQGTLGAASWASGMRAAQGKSLKLGKVDVRAGVAVPLFLGAVACHFGKKSKPYAKHLIAVGNGLAGSVLGEAAYIAGRTWQEKRTAPADAPPASAGDGVGAERREISMDTHPWDASQPLMGGVTPAAETGRQMVEALPL